MSAVVARWRATAVKPVKKHTGHSTKRRVSNSGVGAAPGGLPGVVKVEGHRCETEKGTVAVVI